MRKPERKRPLVRPRCRWEDKIKMDIRDIGWGGNLEHRRDITVYK
jgi:hypothetical protein